MTAPLSLAPVRSHTLQLRSPSTEDTASPPRRAGRFLSAVVACGLLVAGTSPSPASGHLDASAASDTLSVTLAAPEGGTVSEGAKGQFEVSVAGDSSGDSVTVRYAVSGTASSGTDYEALSGTVTVPAGGSGARITLVTLDDDILDDGETVVLELTGATGPGTVVVDASPATATIVDGGTVTVEITPVPDTVAEGEAWVSAVTMSSAVADRVSVRWRTSDGTASAGSDYEAMDSRVVFEPGERSKTIKVKTMEDDEAEAVEMFYVALDALQASNVAGMAASWGGGVRVNTETRRGFIECSVSFPNHIATFFTVVDTVPVGTDVGTPIAANTTGFPFYTLSGGDGAFAINSSTAQIQTTATLDASTESEYDLTVSVLDTCGASASIDVTITVKPPNRASDFDPDSYSFEVLSTAPRGHSVGFVSATDPDGDRITYSLPGSHPFRINGSTGEITVAGTLSVGTYDLSATASDDSLTDTAPVTITVKPPNRAPDFDPDSYSFELLSTAGNGHTVGSVSATDPDDDEIRYSLPGSHPFAINGSTGEITVKPPNRPPVPVGTISGKTVTVADDGSVGVSGYFRDPDGDVLEYTAGSSDTGVVRVDEDGATVTYYGEAVGSATVMVTADDKRGGTAEQSFTVTVEPPPNRPPVPVGTISGKTVTVGDDGSVGVSGYFRDPDGDVLEYTAGSSDTGVVRVDEDGATVTYYGEAVGSATVTVTADDKRGGTAEQSFTVTVEAVVDPCTIDVEDAVLSVPEDAVPGRTEVGRVGVTADSCGAMTYRLSGTGNGRFSVAAVSGSDDDAKITVASGLDHETRASYSLRLTVSSGSASDAGDVSIEVTNVNERPVRVGTISGRRVEAGSSDTVEVSGKFSDPDGDALSYTATTSDTLVADVTVSGSRVIVTGEGRGSATVRVTATDPGTQGFEVVVVVTNRAPVFASGSVERSVAENAGAGTAVGAPVTATDADGDDLSYSLAAGGDAGSFAIDASTGQITVGSGTVLDYESGDTVYTVRVAASDGELADTAGVTIRVTDVPAPGKPAVPELVAVRAGLSVSWAAPANGGPEIGSYDLQFQKKGAGRWTEVSAGLVLEHTIGVVDPGATYEVEVRAVNGEGGGPWSETSEAVIQRAPEFEAAAAERSVAENAGAGTAVGAPVTAFDADGEALAYSFALDADAALFAIDGSTGQITVGEGTVLDYESGATRYEVWVGGERRVAGGHGGGDDPGDGRAGAGGARGAGGEGGDREDRGVVAGARERRSGGRELRSAVPGEGRTGVGRFGVGGHGAVACDRGAAGGHGARGAGAGGERGGQERVVGVGGRDDEPCAGVRVGSVGAPGAGELGGGCLGGRGGGGAGRGWERAGVQLRRGRGRGVVRDRDLDGADHGGCGNGAGLRERGDELRGAGGGERRGAGGHGGGPGRLAQPGQEAQVAAVG